jgi:hypothetical protein
MEKQVRADQLVYAAHTSEAQKIFYTRSSVLYAFQTYEQTYRLLRYSKWWH